MIVAALFVGALVALAVGGASSGRRGSKGQAHGGRGVLGTTTKASNASASSRSGSASGYNKARAKLSWTLVPDARATFDRLANSLPGEVGVVVSPLGSTRVARFGPLQVGHAWSTMKVPVLVTYERRLIGEGRALSAIDKEDATLAVEESDNVAINAIFARLEQSAHGLVPASEAIEQTLRDSGDRLTTVNTIPNDDGFSTFGQTEWSLTASALFYKALANGCLLDSPQTSDVLRLMSHIVGYERFGAGKAGYPRGDPLAFKGGWGPEPDGSYLVRQTAIVGAGGHGYVVSMLARPNGLGTASFASGEQMLTRVARWVRATFNPADSPGPGACLRR
jgi:hypothetical protein